MNREKSEFEDATKRQKIEDFSMFVPDQNYLMQQEEHLRAIEREKMRLMKTKEELLKAENIPGIVFD